MKLKSSLTLFKVASAETIFADVLQKYYSGEPDTTTLKLLDYNVSTASQDDVRKFRVTHLIDYF